jgi:hypothetical protein
LSLLTIIQGAAKELALSSPSAAYTSSDTQIIQLVALAQAEGKELAQDFDWKALTKEKTFTSTAAAAQSGALASDYDRMVPETFWNRTANRSLWGPISPQDWQEAQVLAGTTAVTERWRLRGTDVLITPTPNGTDTYAYEYISTQWCESSGGTDQSAWASDTDTGILPEEVMKLGILWRFLRAKGFDYAEPMRSYELAKAKAQNRDGGGKRTLNFARRNNYRAARIPYVPEGSWSL